MWRKLNLISPWALTLRAFGLVLILYALLRMLAAPELTLIVFVLAGSLLWLAGTAAEERSPLYRRLQGTVVRNIMRTSPLRAPAWLSVSGFRSQHPELTSDGFIVTVQDGYDAGIATADQVRSVPDDVARHTSLAQIGRPLGYVHALHTDDPVLEAFLRLRHSDHVFLPVFDRMDVLVGIVTRQDIDRWLTENGRGAPRVLASPDALYNISRRRGALAA